MSSSHATMLRIIIVCFGFLLPSVVSKPTFFFSNSSGMCIPKEPIAPQSNCNTTCTNYAVVTATCGSKSCACNSTYLQAQGDCSVCRSRSAQEAALAQLYADENAYACAQFLVDGYYHQRAVLDNERKAFLALQIAGGHVGLVILLLFSVFSRRINRGAAFANFCITWIFSSVVYSLSLYRKQTKGVLSNSLDPVPYSICVAQASLINGVQVMTACSTLALVIQLWLGIYRAIYGDLSRDAKQKKFTTFMLVVSPYLLFFAVIIPSMFIGKARTLSQSTVERSLPANFYCSTVNSKELLRAVYGMTMGLLVIATVFDALSIVTLYRHWTAFRRMEMKGGIALSTLIRVVLFSVYRVMVAVAYGTILNNPPSNPRLSGLQVYSHPLFISVPVWVDMLQATIPIVAFLMLGTNADMFKTIICWRNDTT